MFLHDSLNKEKFNKDKKLNLLKKKYITIAQFLALLLSDDPYILIGSTLVDKNCKDLFIKLWKNHTHNIISILKLQKISIAEIVNNLNIIIKYFPLARILILLFYAKLLASKCKLCTKNRYILLIAKIIKLHYNDGRLFPEKDAQFFKSIINKYFPFLDNKSQVGILTTHYFDNTWIQPDSLINIGYDLIDGLTHCFLCTKKHLIRSKTLFNELILGYPNYASMIYNLLTLANKVVLECYVLYWDAIGQIDMASCLLVGQVILLPLKYRLEIILLANNIRIARIKFQLNILEVPDWNKLLISVQLLQNKINKLIEK